MDIKGAFDTGKGFFDKSMDWIADNPKKFAGVAVAKGTVVGGGIATYQTFKSSSTSSTSTNPNNPPASTDSVSTSQNKGETFAKHFAEDIALTFVGGGLTYGIARKFYGAANGAAKLKGVAKAGEIM
jgi:hypothetical protein